jgi:hypothetical protein
MKHGVLMKSCQTSTKQSTQQRARKRYKIDRPKFMSKEETTNWGISQGEHEQIKDSNVSSQGAYHRRRGEML